MNIVILIVLGFAFTIVGRVADPDMSIWRFAYVIAGCEHWWMMQPKGTIPKFLKLVDSAIKARCHILGTTKN